MTAGRVYLDYNASAPLRPEVVEAMLRVLTASGNGSSVHREGRAARAAIEEARGKVAALVGGGAAKLVFTSGGTEANVLALSPHVRIRGFGGRSKDLPPSRCFIGATEHPSVLAGGRFPAEAVTVIPVGANGLVDVAWLAEHLDASDGWPFVSLQMANNETGVLQPIADVARLVHAAGGVLHVDAVQAAGKLPIDFSTLGADMLSFSAHKFGGPQGAGALVYDPSIDLGPALLSGGGQEEGHRAGTENLAAIVGFGSAAAIAFGEIDHYMKAMAEMRDRIEHHIRGLLPDVVVFGGGVERLANTSAFAIPGVKAETLVMAFDLAGVAVSSGSACSSGKVRPSHVLAAMGIEPAVAEGAVRVSLGWATSEEDVERFAAAFAKVTRSVMARRQGDRAA
ncbi:MULTISPECIES: cysteine desulfurase family protein [unclassified Chelatococcus]|uniref:cysteine desulfurase family protein n=1 Tax=unclassified Chelatococcus TaxID=2638111 RepID=UPI001BD0FB3A|nr:MULTISPECIES: cysteine desulfurase family protein [unclassified Chelatococcus]MBS7699384.1 cysteine desulfurase [Chelatococcus sp. YT9]MBX3557724.1 cysteine desulfurase [Chelatococcus sp.]